MSITRGAIDRICQGLEAGDSKPILQVLNVKQVGGGERFRVIVSDGVHYAQGMLATQLNHLVKSMPELCLIQVHRALVNQVQTKKVVILLNIVVLGPSSKVGSPVEWGNVSPAITPAVPQSKAVTPARAPGLYNNHLVSKAPHPIESNHESNPYSARPTTGHAPIVRNQALSSEAHFTPISALNPYANRWTIKARITNKGDIRTWSNARGEGSLFSIDLLDASGVDIRATFFKEAVDKFYHLLEVDKVYTISGGRIKAANLQYNTCKSPHELSFDANAEIHQVEDATIAKQSFDRVHIAQLSQMEPNQMIDIVGVVKSASEVQSIISRKTQKELFKADLVVADESQAEVSVTIWGEKAKTASRDYKGQPVVGFKKLKLGDYGGRSCSVSGGAIIINPQVPEAQLLASWWTSQGRHSQLSSLSGGGGGGMGATRMEPLEQRKLLRDIKGDHMGFQEKPDFICVRGMFTFFRLKDDGPWYTACANPDPPCNNRTKATLTSDQHWHCERCQQTRDSCTRRYILSATIADDTCTTWVSLFNEQVLEVIGQDHTADALYAKYFSETSNPDEYPIEHFNQIFEQAKFTEWIFKIKIKNEEVSGESRTKATVYALVPVDYTRESRELLDAIAKMQI